MIAFFGMGMLGSGFVRALRRRGEDVNVWNRTPAKAKRLEADGAHAFADPADAAAKHSVDFDRSQAVRLQWLIAGDRAAGRHTVLTVPTIGWVPLTDSPDKHPYSCGFPTNTFPGQQSTDPYDDHCGNGVQGNGNAIRGNDPTFTSRAVDPACCATSLISRAKMACRRWCSWMKC